MLNNIFTWSGIGKSDPFLRSCGPVRHEKIECTVWGRLWPCWLLEMNCDYWHLYWLFPQLIHAVTGSIFNLKPTIKFCGFYSFQVIPELDNFLCGFYSCLFIFVDMPSWQIYRDEASRSAALSFCFFKRFLASSAWAWQRCSVWSQEKDMKPRNNKTWLKTTWLLIINNG